MKNFFFSKISQDLNYQMAFVHRVNNDGDGDPFYETIGLVTLEDVSQTCLFTELVLKLKFRSSKN